MVLPHSEVLSHRSHKELRHSCRKVEDKPMKWSFARSIAIPSACTTGVWCLLSCGRLARYWQFKKLALRESGDTYFVEGGQAVNYWAEYIDAENPVQPLEMLRPFTSKDCDVWINRTTWERLKKSPGGKLRKGTVALPRRRTPGQAKGRGSRLTAATWYQPHRMNLGRLLRFHQKTPSSSSHPNQNGP